MVDDALTVKHTPEQAWGGPRTPTWRQQGKRAVILLPAEVYEVVRDVGYMTRWSARDLNFQIYCAGAESLLGVPFSALFGEYTYDPSLRVPHRSQRPVGHDEVRELVRQAFLFGAHDGD